MAAPLRQSLVPIADESGYDLEVTHAETQSLSVWVPVFFLAVAAVIWAAVAAEPIIGVFCLMIAIIAGGKDVITLMRMGRRFQSVMLEANTMRSLGYSEYTVRVDQINERVHITLIASEPPSLRPSAPYILLERNFRAEQSQEAVECKTDFETIAISLREAARDAAEHRALEDADRSAEAAEAELLVRALRETSSLPALGE
jgi:hypothetical protein